MIISKHKGIKFHFYADDSQIYVHLSQKNAYAAFEQLNRCLDDFKEWMSTSKLKLNPDKTKFIWLKINKEINSNIPDGENKKLSSPIWYNPMISKIELFLPQWFNKGIIFVSALIDSKEKNLTHHDLITKYSGPYNFLEYHRVRQCVNNFIGKSNMLTNIRPNHVKTLHLLSKGTKGSCEHYKTLLLQKSYNDVKLRHKWETLLNIEVTEKAWQKCYLICFKLYRIII